MIAWLVLACTEPADTAIVAPPPPPPPAPTVPAPAPAGDSRLEPDVAPFVPPAPLGQVLDSQAAYAKLKYAEPREAVVAAFAAHAGEAVLSRTDTRLVVARWTNESGRPTLWGVTVAVEADGTVEVSVSDPLGGLGLPRLDSCGADHVGVTAPWPAGGSVTACVDEQTRKLDGPFALTQDAVRLTGAYEQGLRTGEWVLTDVTTERGRGSFADGKPVGTWKLATGAVTFGDDGRPVDGPLTLLEPAPEDRPRLVLVGARLGSPGPARSEGAATGGRSGARAEAKAETEAGPEDAEVGAAVLRGWVVLPDAGDCKYKGSPEPRAVARFELLQAAGPTRVLEVGRKPAGACASTKELAAARAKVESALTEANIDPLLPPPRTLPLRVTGEPPSGETSGDPQSGRTSTPVKLGARTIALQDEPAPASLPVAAWFDDLDLLSRPFCWSPREDLPAVVVTLDGAPIERVYTTAWDAELLVEGSRFAVLWDGRRLGPVHELPP